MTYEYSKDDIKHFTIELIDKIFNESGNEISEENFHQVINIIQNALEKEFLPINSFIFTSKHQVVCQLRNNSEPVNLTDSIQCQGCKRYFCNKHNMNYCPECKSQNLNPPTGMGFFRGR